LKVMRESRISGWTVHAGEFLFFAREWGQKSAHGV